MKSRAKKIWKAMSEEQRRKALVYYCNLAQQVHHNCEHGGFDFARDLVTVRKDHTCSDCGCEIHAGEQCRKQTYPIVRGGSPEYKSPDFYCMTCYGVERRRAAASRVSRVQRVADKAKAIHIAHEEGAYMDAGFDAGEFSGPAHECMAEKEVRELCALNGVEYEEVENELLRRANEAQELSAALTDSPR